MNNPLVLILCVWVFAPGTFLPRTVAVAAAHEADPALRDSPGPVAIAEVQMGFAGKYKLGYWAPLRVTLQARKAVTGRLEVTVPDGDGVPTTVSSGNGRPIHLSPGHTITEMLYVKPGQASGSLTVQFLDESAILAERVFYPGESGGFDEIPQGLPATARLLVVVGGEIGLQSALRVGEEDAAVATHVAVVRTADELPNESIGWDGVDGAVLITSDPELYHTERFSHCRLALSKWLRIGGRVFLFVGQSGEGLLADGGPLATFVPGQYVRQESLLPSDVEKLCDSQYRLPVPPGLRLHVPYIDLASVDGRIVAAGQGDNLPLVVRAVRGFGELTWVGLDVDIPPIIDWTGGRPELLRRIVGVSQDAQSNVASDAGQLTSLGYTDLVGQLRAALEVFSGVRTYPFAWVIGITLMYLALLGPLDYLLVRRWGRRPVLTWLTLPLFVLVVGGGAYGLAKGTKGNTVRLNQVEVVDFDAVSGLVRGTVWANLYTPRHDRFTLSLDPQLPGGMDAGAGATETVLSWLALPGKGLGGMEAAADASFIERGYRYDLDRSHLEGLPLPMWSSKSLHASWTTHAKPSLPFQSALTPDAIDELKLAGTLNNELDQDLANVRLYYRGRFCRLGTLASGQSIELDQDTLWISAGNDLTGRTLSKDAPPYDAAARDARRVLQMIMWYDLAGGANYVGLLNRYHARLEFGHLLDAGRAVLVAECAHPGSRIHDNNEPISDAEGQKLLMYRFVLPVAYVQ